MRSELVAPRVLLRVEPLVREAERVARVGRLVGQEHGAEGARDVEGLAVLGEGPDGGVDERLLVALPDARQHAELVAPEPVGRAAVARDERELRAEPDEERVPGGVPERVVVALEAVEVEDHQHRRHRLVRLERRVEVDQEPAPVPEAGERVGDGVVPREHVEPRVLPERQHQPHEHEGERERGEGDRGDVDLLEVVDDEDADRGRGAEERDGEERAALDVERALVPRAGPRGGGDAGGTRAATARRSRRPAGTCRPRTGRRRRGSPSPGGRARGAASGARAASRRARRSRTTAERRRTSPNG